MADQSLLNSSQLVSLAICDNTGLEKAFVEGTTNGDAYTFDAVRVSAVDGVIALTTTPTLLKVGVSELPNRRYFFLQALNNGVVWGFSNTTQSFSAFKDQLICLPIGVSVWAKMSSGTGSVAFGEGT